MLIHDDPSYFYRILPYAYVLNVSDTWSKKFENIVIEQPDWYVGNSNLFNSYILTNSLTHMNQQIATKAFATNSSSAFSSSHGGFGGSGFSGGSSGGGFGGGGGGSW